MCAPQLIPRTSHRGRCVATLTAADLVFGPSCGQGCNPMHYACLSGQLHIVKWLHGEGQPIGARSQAGLPLDLACSAGHVDVAEWLYTNGAAIDEVDEDGYQPIHRACCKGHLLIVRWLHQMGADLKVPTRDGHSPLQLAKQHQRADVAAWLIEQIGDDEGDLSA